MLRIGRDDLARLLDEIPALRETPDQLVVCGDPDFIREVGGPDLARRLNVPSQ